MKLSNCRVSALISAGMIGIIGDMKKSEIKTGVVVAALGVVFGGIGGARAGEVSMIGRSPYEDGLCTIKWEFCKTADWKGERQDNQYRIPGVSISDEGEVVAVYDCRYMSDRDLGWNHGGGLRGFDKDGKSVEGVDQSGWEPIDIAGNISLDRGRHWGPAEVFIDVPNSSEYESRGEPTAAWKAAKTKEGFDIGDPVVQYDPQLKRFWLMGITGGGLRSAGWGNDCVLYWRDGSIYSSDKRWKPYENPDGVSGRSIKKMVIESLVAANGNGVDAATIRAGTVFQGPGQGMVTTKEVKTALGDVLPVGTVVIPMQWFGPGLRGCYDFAIYGVEDAQGRRIWKSTGLVMGSSQEPQITELDDGSWLMMTKGYSRGRRRYFRTTDFKDWREAAGGPGGQQVQGSIVKLGRSAKLGCGLYATVFDRGANRSKLTLSFGKDMTADASTAAEGVRWNFDDINFPDIMIFEEPTDGKGYNSLVMLDENTLGVVYEAKNHIYVDRIDVTEYLK